MEKIAYAILGVATLGWLAIVLWESALAFWPHGLVGMLFIVGCGVLLIKALADRLSNKEDDHYLTNVDE